jgi:hypothetical protein
MPAFREIQTMALIAVLLILTACSGQQIYSTGQAWQMNQCFKIINSEERSRCLEVADTPYYEYKRNEEGAE